MRLTTLIEKVMEETQIETIDAVKTVVEEPVTVETVTQTHIEIELDNDQDPELIKIENSLKKNLGTRGIELIRNIAMDESLFTYTSGLDGYQYIPQTYVNAAITGRDKRYKHVIKFLEKISIHQFKCQVTIDMFNKRFIAVITHLSGFNVYIAATYRKNDRMNVLNFMIKALAKYIYDYSNGKYNDIINNFTNIRFHKAAEIRKAREAQRLKPKEFKDKPSKVTEASPTALFKGLIEQLVEVNDIEQAINSAAFNIPGELKGQLVNEVTNKIVEFHDKQKSETTVSVEISEDKLVENNHDSDKV